MSDSLNQQQVNQEIATAQRPDRRPYQARLPDGVSMTLPAGASGLQRNERFTVDKQFGYTFGNHVDFTPAQQADLVQLVRGNHAAFAFSLDELPGYSGTLPDAEMKINLTTTDPVFTRSRRKSLVERQIADDKCGQLARLGFIELAAWPAHYASEVTCPAKKALDGQMTDRRFCGDYRAINDFTEQDKHAMPLADDLFDRAGQCRVFSKLDLRSGFHQIRMHPDHKCKTAVWWNDQLWQYTRMPFGLKNASAQFQRTVDHELGRAGLLGFARAYIDDIVIFSNKAEDHFVHLAKVLKCLTDCGLRVHPEKSVFGAEGIEYLGHYLGAQGLQPLEAKVKAFRDLPSPRNRDQLRIVLGMLGYYRNFAPQFSTIAAPLTKLLRDTQAWQWAAEQERAYQEIKDVLCTPGVVLRPIVPGRALSVHTDFSGVGLGALLTQTDTSGNEYVCAALSRSLNVHERNYSSYEGEMLACVWAIKSLHHHLFGVPFTVVTDHQPLTYLLKAQNLQGKHARWALMLSAYMVTIKHRPGKRHQNADCLSRLVSPTSSSDDCTGARLDGPALSEPTTAMLAAVASRHTVTHQRWLTEQATHWVRVSQATTLLPTPTQVAQLLPEKDAQGIRGTRALNTSVLPAGTLAAARRAGVTLYEPFGGICSGLDMLLRNGVRVTRYLYSDIAEDAQLAAAHRVRALHQSYPHLLPLSALGCIYQLPQDVSAVTSSSLLEA